jgi:hypothetical protein
MPATRSHTRQLSKGHVGIIAGLEYFKIENGDTSCPSTGSGQALGTGLYRGWFGNPIDLATGYRAGALWEAPAHLAVSQFEAISSVFRSQSQI